MSETPHDPTEPAEARPAETLAEAEDALLSRWPESRLDPTLDRITCFVELLGNPQDAYRTVQLTGTNGPPARASPAGAGTTEPCR